MSNFKFKMPVYKKLKEYCPVYGWTEGEIKNNCNLLETQDIIGDTKCRKINCLILRTLKVLHNNYLNISYKNLKSYCGCYKIKDSGICTMREALEVGMFSNSDVYCRKEYCPIMALMKAYQLKKKGYMMKWCCLHYSSVYCDSFNKCKSYREKCVYKLGFEKYCEAWVKK